MPGGALLCLLGLFVILITIMGTFYEVGWAGLVYFIRRLRSLAMLVGAQLCLLGLFVILITIMGTFYEVGFGGFFFGFSGCSAVVVLIGALLCVVLCWACWGCLRSSSP